MKNQSRLITIAAMLLVLSSCSKSNDTPTIVYQQEDQMGRPAINTVFVSSGDKDSYNQTIPSMGTAMWQSKFQSTLLALNPGYTTNLLGLDAATFTTVLSADVLSVSLTGKTTFYDGTNVLTGRTLDDDVIPVELTLVFGGPDGSSNPGLTNDHTNVNDKAFLTTFPYLAAPF
jgi:hypothetical protein